MVELLREAGALEEGDLYDINNIIVVHHVNQALRAHTLFHKDSDYIVKDDKVVIIDEFTGRMMEGRRYSEGLHQALEAKENVYIQPENVTLASITFQNYFRLYEKLAGMTGTAMTEAAEFMDIYSLDVVEIPTNRPIDPQGRRRRGLSHRRREIRRHHPADRGMPQDAASRCWSARCRSRNRKLLSALLKKRKIKHNVLNARYHEQEAAIVAQAGVSGTVTIATNMAGRGTDIQLGGNPDMRILTELAVSHRPIERAGRIAANQGRGRRRQGKGRCGRRPLHPRHRAPRKPAHRQSAARPFGPPGRSRARRSSSSRLQDDLMRIFGSERMDTMLQRLGLKQGEAIAHPWVNKALEKAQQKVEARNFEIRKNMLKYDNVLNDQRKVIFEQRLDIMRAEVVDEIIADMRAQTVEDLVRRHIPERAYAEQWDAPGLAEEVQKRLRPSRFPSSTGPRKKASPTRRCASASPTRWKSAPPSAPPISASKSPAISKSRSCCRRSTTIGASTSSTSTICASTSACGAMASAIR